MDSRLQGREKIQLTKLKEDREFIIGFKKLIVGDLDISYEEKLCFLNYAIVLFKVYDQDNRYKSYFKLAYYIIIKYSLLFEDYRPLYDISLQIGFFPICKTLIDKNLISLSSVSEVISQALLTKKFTNERGLYIETLEQSNSVRNLIESKSKCIAYIAPTSFGKSSLIKDLIQRNNFSKIGIIVPTKSLLIQTFNDIKGDSNLKFKLILHDEMFDNNEKFIGILTQERATRLIQKNIAFDVLFIDEAHNMLKF